MAGQTQDSYLRGGASSTPPSPPPRAPYTPGYGFLSENAGFARQVEAAGLAFVGPAPAHLEAFGAKHTARELARAAGVPMLAGTGLLASADEAVTAAREIGFPVMVKATGGGGGIGLLACHDARRRVRPGAAARQCQLRHANSHVTSHDRRRPASSWSGSCATPGTWRSRSSATAPGRSRCSATGTARCSAATRRSSKRPRHPALPAAVRRRLHEAARELAASVGYRSAGTVEFVYDPEREEASFLEVNARLQVEHPVTEEVYGVDLVEQMLRLAGQGADGVSAFMAARHAPRGHAVEARVYAEDPSHGGRPSPGLVTAVTWPHDAGIRVDAWIEAGLEVSPSYDPMLAKVIAAGRGPRAGA